MNASLIVSPAQDPTHDLIWVRESGQCMSLNDFMRDRDYGQAILDGRLAVELERLEGEAPFVCPYCDGAMGLRSKKIRQRTEVRFYFEHLSRHLRKTCAGREGHAPQAILARKFALHKEGTLHKAFKQWVIESLEADPSFEKIRPETRWWDLEGVKWRQPDVQAMRDGQGIAFEVQLATTFVYVIAERMKFYRDNAGRMLWLFKDLDIGAFRLSEDDVFYANNRNAFRVTPATVARSQREGRLYLEAVWVEPYLEDGRLKERTAPPQEVSFDHVIFDTGPRGIPRSYVYDYEGHRRRLESELAAMKEAQVWDQRREAFEAFYLALLRGELPDLYERGRRWGAMRTTFRTVGIELPEYPREHRALDQFLVAGYTAKHGDGVPIGIGFSTLAELGHHMHTKWPETLWFFRCMLRTHEQLPVLIKQDRTKSFQGKMRRVLESLADGEPFFEPDRVWDPLLVRLFPEVADLWAKDAGDVARVALQAAPRLSPAAEQQA